MKPRSLLFLLWMPYLAWLSCNSKETAEPKNQSTENKMDSTSYLKEPDAGQEGRLLLDGRVCMFDDIDSIQKKMNVPLEAASPRELEQIQSIMGVIGLPQNFKIFRGNGISNAFATLINNQRIIVYNKDMFSQIDKLSESYWASMFILAHEIGHHLAFHMSDEGNPIQDELEADKFAAETLFKMGADSNQVLSAVGSRFISNRQDTKTHPSKSRRLAEVKKGWYTAAELRHQDAVPPPPNDQESFNDSFSPFELFNGVSPETSGSDPMESIDFYKSHNFFSDSLSGIIVDVAKSAWSGAELVLDVKVLITDVKDESKNQLHFAKGERYDFRVCYNQGPAMAARPGAFKHYFCAGRRMKFNVVQVNFIRAFYYYISYAAHPANMDNM